MKSITLILIVAILFFCSEISLSQNTINPALVDQSYNLYKAGDVFIAGQPTSSNLDSLAEIGVKLIINLRTQGEMEALDYDEAAQAKKLGIKYEHYPMGGADGYNPDVIKEMGKQIKKSKGQVLIHCRSAGRATYAWMAWMVRYQDISIDEAVELGSKMRFSLPFADLLGYPITIQQLKD